MKRYKTICVVIVATLMCFGCQPPNLSDISAKPKEWLSNAKSNLPVNYKNDNAESKATMLTLDKILSTSSSDVDVGNTFSAFIRNAVTNDPTVQSVKSRLEANEYSVGITRAQKDFKFSSTLYAGIEDLTDETAGLAVVLDANKIIFDGGAIDAQILRDTFTLEASRQDYISTLNDRANHFLDIWVDLEQYSALNANIERRLVVLNPLIEQLEKVAQAGVGDVSKVAAAQRTVSAIKVTQTDVAERLLQAQLSFENAFGFLPVGQKFDGELIKSAVPDQITNEIYLGAPALMAQYARYKATEAEILISRAKNDFNVGFQTRVSRPFSGSDFSSDESIGLVVRKDLYQGETLKLQIDNAKAEAVASIAATKATYREGKRRIKTALQTIMSMDKAVRLARENAKVTAEEIAYLRKQLVIGGSSLDSVLSAEARLYEAESQEVNFLAERRKSELRILNYTGLLSKALGI